ncbi:MAG: hypothetical protein ACE5GK_07630 [Nitrospiria bacterium]
MTQRCPQCGGKLFGKSAMGKGIVSLIFGSFWGVLAMLAAGMDKTAFYLCLTVFIILFSNGVWKIYTSLQTKH